jgi:hypothetical protein
VVTAVVRVVIDPDGRLSAADYEDGIRLVRSPGIDVIAGPGEYLPESLREIGLVVEDWAGEWSTDQLLARCREVFGIEPRLGVITYISRGTDDDARGVLARFGVPGDVRRECAAGEEIVIVTISADAARKVPESRLRTALEAALNAEVQIVTSPV